MLTNLCQLPPIHTAKHDPSRQITKARLIQHYVYIAKIDRLPSPFNLVQSVFSAPMLIVDWFFETTLHSVTKRFVGRAVFWAMLGPVSVAAGWLLWISSVPKMITEVCRTNVDKSIVEKIVRVFVSMALCTAVAPFWLLILWVKGGFAGMRRVFARMRNRDRRICCGGEERVVTARPSRRPSLQDPDGDATNSVGNEREDVVVVMLSKTEGGEGSMPVGLCGPCLSYVGSGFAIL